LTVSDEMPSAAAVCRTGQSATNHSQSATNHSRDAGFGHGQTEGSSCGFRNFERLRVRINHQHHRPRSLARHITRGEFPHPRHLPALARLAGVELPNELLSR